MLVHQQTLTASCCCIWLLCMCCVPALLHAVLLWPGAGGHAGLGGFGSANLGPPPGGATGHQQQHGNNNQQVCMW